MGQRAVQGRRKNNKTTIVVVGGRAKVGVRVAVEVTGVPVEVQGNLRLLSLAGARDQQQGVEKCCVVWPANEQQPPKLGRTTA